MKHIYIVMVQPTYGLPHVSGEAYDSLKGAQDFIEHRSDYPIKETDFLYQGRTCSYAIHALAMR